MTVNHKLMQWIVAVSVGILLALYAYNRVSDPEPAMQRAKEESVVLAAREILGSYIAPQKDLETVDPLAPNRKIGKVYVYPTEGGWEVSGHYRRNERDSWHPFLMSLAESVELTSLSVQDDDPRLVELASKDARFSAVP